MDTRFEFIRDIRFFRDLENTYRTEMFATHILPYFQIAEYQIIKNLGVQGLVNKRRVGQFKAAALKRVAPIIHENGIESVWNAALSYAGPFGIVDNHPGTLSFICAFFLQTPAVFTSPIGLECLDQLSKPSWFKPNLKPETQEFLIDLVAIGFYQMLLGPEAVTSFNFRYEYYDLKKFVLPGYISRYYSDIKKANEFVLKNSKEKPELYVSLAINPNRRTELIHRLVYFETLYRTYSLKKQRALDHEGFPSLFYYERSDRFASPTEFWTMIHMDIIKKDAVFKFLLQKGEVNVLLTAMKDFFIQSKSGNSNPLSSLLDPIPFLYADGKRVTLNLMRANSEARNPTFSSIISKAFDTPFDTVNEALEKIGHPVRRKLNQSEMD